MHKSMLVDVAYDCIPYGGILWQGKAFVNMANDHKFAKFFLTKFYTRSAIGNTLYQQVFYIGYQISMCRKLLVDPI